MQQAMIGISAAKALSKTCGRVVGVAVWLLLQSQTHYMHPLGHGSSSDSRTKGLQDGDNVTPRPAAMSQQTGNQTQGNGQRLAVQQKGP
jgi:hypothetical protein